VPRLFAGCFNETVELFVGHAAFLKALPNRSRDFTERPVCQNLDFDQGANILFRGFAFVMPYLL